MRLGARGAAWALERHGAQGSHQAKRRIRTKESLVRGWMPCMRIDEEFCNARVGERGPRGIGCPAPGIKGYKHDSYDLGPRGIVVVMRFLLQLCQTMG